MKRIIQLLTAWLVVLLGCVVAPAVIPGTATPVSAQVFNTLCTAEWSWPGPWYSPVYGNLIRWDVDIDCSIPVDIAVVDMRLEDGANVTKPKFYPAGQHGYSGYDSDHFHFTAYEPCYTPNPPTYVSRWRVRGSAYVVTYDGQVIVQDPQWQVGPVNGVPMNCQRLSQ